MRASNKISSACKGSFLSCFFLISFLNSNSVAGESSLDRLACGLGGKTVLPHIIVSVPQMLQNGNLCAFFHY